MGRPDITVLKDIKGYKFKKARNEGEVFVTSPGGVNFGFDVEVFRELIKQVDTDPKLREKFGLK